MKPLKNFSWEGHEERPKVVRIPVYGGPTRGYPVPPRWDSLLSEPQICETRGGNANKTWRDEYDSDVCNLILVKIDGLVKSRKMRHCERSEAI
jgi:hypothetical protein